jgi:hydroxymethylbilane synthase
VVERLQQEEPALEIVIEQIRTTGDAITHVPLTQIGGDGVFVMEIERALLERHIDLAVHSLKDLPTAQPQGLCAMAAGAREDVRDVLVVNGQGDYGLASAVEAGRLRIGTCSLRRAAQIRAIFPGVEILPLRGNVDTRLRKLEAGEYDGIVLAAAGMHRLGVYERLAGRMDYLPVEVMMPAPGQGALALEIRDEPEMQRLIAPLRNAATQSTTSAERMFMRHLGAGCYLPVAAHGEVVEGKLMLQGLVISLDGQRQVRVHGSIPWTPETTIEHAEQLAVKLAEQALAQGAAEIINMLDDVRVRERHHV